MLVINKGQISGTPEVHTCEHFAYIKGDRTQFHFQIQFQILGFVWVYSSHLRYVKVPLKSSAATPLAQPIASLNFRCTFTYLRWDESGAATPLAQPIASNSAHITINSMGWASCTLTSYVDLFFFVLPFLLLKLTSNSRFFFKFFLYAYIIFILITIDLNH